MLSDLVYVDMEDVWILEEQEESTWIDSPCSPYRITAGLHERLTDPISGLALAKGTLRQRLAVIKRYVEFYFAEVGDDVATPEEVFGSETRMKDFLGTMPLR